jgi:hypothetical protein
MVNIIVTTIAGFAIIGGFGVLFSLFYWVSQKEIVEKIIKTLSPIIGILIVSFFVGFVTRFIFEI